MEHGLNYRIAAWYVASLGASWAVIIALLPLTMLLSIFGLFVSVVVTFPLATGGGLVLKRLGWTSPLHALCFGIAGGAAALGLLATCLDRQHITLTIWWAMCAGAVFGAVAALTTRTLLSRYGVLDRDELPEGYDYRPAP